MRRCPLLTSSPLRLILSGAREESWELERDGGHTRVRAGRLQLRHRGSSVGTSRLWGESPGSVVRRQDANELIAGCGWPLQAGPEPFSAKHPLGASWRIFLMRRLAVTPVLLTMAAAVLLSGCNKLQARVELNKGTTYYKNEKYQDALIQFQKGLAPHPGT